MVCYHRKGDISHLEGAAVKPWYLAQFSSLQTHSQGLVQMAFPAPPVLWWARRIMELAQACAQASLAVRQSLSAHGQYRAITASSGFLDWASPSLHDGIFVSCWTTVQQSHVCKMLVEKAHYIWSSSSSVSMRLWRSCAPTFLLLWNFFKQNWAVKGSCKPCLDNSLEMFVLLKINYSFRNAEDKLSKLLYPRAQIEHWSSKAH